MQAGGCQQRSSLPQVLSSLTVADIFYKIEDIGRYESDFAHGGNDLAGSACLDPARLWTGRGAASEKANWKALVGRDHVHPAGSAGEGRAAGFLRGGPYRP